MQHFSMQTGSMSDHMQRLLYCTLARASGILRGYHPCPQIPHGSFITLTHKACRAVLMTVCRAARLQLAHRLGCSSTKTSLKFPEKGYDHEQHINLTSLRRKKIGITVACLGYAKCIKIHLSIHNLQQAGKLCGDVKYDS